MPLKGILDSEILTIPSTIIFIDSLMATATSVTLAQGVWSHDKYSTKRSVFVWIHLETMLKCYFMYHTSMAVL